MPFGKVLDKIKKAEVASHPASEGGGVGEAYASIKRKSQKLHRLARGDGSISDGMDELKFGVSELQKYGQVDHVKALAYDPVQSLMAVVDEFNTVTVFGQSRVSSKIDVQSTNPITRLAFVKGVYLVAFDGIRTIFVISLVSRSVMRKITVETEVTAFESDYSLEFIFVGLKTGVVRGYDIETGNKTLLNFSSAQGEKFPLVRDRQVTSLKIHPRDVGTLLIAYPKMAVSYNLLEDKVIHSFVYSLEHTATGGENATYRYASDGLYTPSVVQVLWHPNGLHILTVHDDNSLVFWDAKTGERILARTIFDSFVDAKTGRECIPEPNRMTPIIKIEWICGKDAEKTSLLVLGGDGYENEGYHQLVRMDFGKMISYSMTSYDGMAKYYSQPKQQSVFAIHSRANIDNFLPLPSRTPYFGGNQDPKVIAIVMSDGSLKFVNYPEGNLSLEARKFPATLSWLNPKITCTTSSYLDRRTVNGVFERLAENVGLLKGGIPSKPKYRADVGAVIITGHESGYLRIWDSSEGDLNSASVLEVDISDILESDSSECSVSKISFSPEQMELSCSLFNGDVLLFSFQVNKLYDSKAVVGMTRRMSSLSFAEKAIVDISDRAPLNIRKGFMPKVLLRPLDNGNVTALCNSNVGFVAVGYESGRLLVIDRRGNVIIHNEVLEDPGLSIKILPTALEFGYGLAATGDQKCSVLLYVGTSIGRLITYRLQADSVGRFSAHRLGQVDANETQIMDILAVNSVTGRPCNPTIQNLQSDPAEVDLTFPLVVSTSDSDIRVTKNNEKVSHKSYGKGNISKIGITGAPSAIGRPSFCVVAIHGSSNKMSTLSLPSLSSLADIKLPYQLSPSFVKQSSVLPLGDVFLRISEAEAAFINIMGQRRAMVAPEADFAGTLFLKNIIIPQRPTFNQVLKNTPTINYSQLYTLLEGRDRPLHGQNEEYALAWSVSPHNPSNYSVLGTSKPRYYNSSEATRNEGVGMSPKLKTHSRHPSSASWNVNNLKKYASSAWENSTNAVGNYAGEMNEQFDKFVSDTKKDVAKNYFRDALG